MKLKFLSFIVWSQVCNQEAVDLEIDFYNKDTMSVSKESEHLLWSCKKLVEVAINRGSKDDVIVLIVDLTQFQKRD